MHSPAISQPWLLSYFRPYTNSSQNIVSLFDCTRLDVMKHFYIGVNMVACLLRITTQLTKTLIHVDYVREVQ